MTKQELFIQYIVQALSQKTNFENPIHAAKNENNFAMKTSSFSIAKYEGNRKGGEGEMVSAL